MGLRHELRSCSSDGDNLFVLTDYLVGRKISFSLLEKRNANAHAMPPRPHSICQMQWVDQLASAFKLKRLDFRTYRNVVENMAGNRPALETDVVLSCVFSNLNTKDLLRCRLVAKTWEINAGAILKAKPLFMSFYKRANYEKIPSPIDEKALRATLQLIGESFKSNPNFPCLGLRMCGDYWKLKSFQEFVATHGKHFKRLRIANLSHRIVVVLLGNYFRDIEYLHIWGSFKENGEPADGTASGEGLLEDLKSLKTLIVPNNIKREDTLKISLCEKIIRAGPNLSKIVNFVCQLAPVLKECNKMHLITDFDMYTQKVELADLKFFAKTFPRLKTLDLCPFNYILEEYIENYDYDMDLYCKTLFDIMDSSKGTLTKLVTHMVDMVPVLPNVKHLRIERDPEGYCVVPRLCRRMGVAQCFPALQQVCLNCTHCYDYEVKKYLEGFGPFPNVKILELEQPWEGNTFDYIKEYFPNVTHLKVKVGFDFILDLQEGMTFCNWDLWTVPWDLETLEVKNVVVQDFDSLLTGIAIRKCKRLRFQSKVYKRKGSYDYLRVRRNVTNYPALKNLTMFFMDSFELNDEEKTYESLENLSPIGVWYGLNLMPCLATVKFQYDFHGRHADRISKVLKPYAAFVAIEHRDASELY